MSLLWWVNLDLVFLECSNVSSSAFLGVCGIDMASESSFYGIHCCFPVLLENRCGLSCTELAGLCVELDFHVVRTLWSVYFSFKVSWCQEVDNYSKFWNWLPGLWLSVPLLQYHQEFCMHTEQKIKPKVNGEAIFHRQKEPKGFTEIYSTETREESDRSDWEEKRENQCRIHQST